MGDVKVTLSSKTEIKGKTGYSYTFNKVEGDKVIGSITIYDYEGDGLDNHDGVVNNNFGEITNTIFGQFAKESGTGYRPDYIQPANSKTDKIYEDVKGEKTDKGFKITSDNKTTFNLGSLAKNIDYKNNTFNSASYLNMYKSSAFSFNPMTMPGAGGVNMPFLFEGGSGYMPTTNVDYAGLSKDRLEAKNMIEGTIIAGMMGDQGIPPMALDSLVVNVFNKFLSRFSNGSINLPGQNTPSADNATKKNEENAKKLEALKAEAKNVNVTVEEKDTLETLQAKVDAKKLENLKAEAKTLKITFEEKITLTDLQKLVDDKKAELAKTKVKPQTEKKDDKPLEYTNSGKKIKVYKNDKGNQVHEEYDANGKKVYSCEYTKDGYIINNYDKDGNAKTLNLTKDGKTMATTPEKTTPVTNKTTKNEAGQTLVETTDSQGNKVVITMDKNMNTILKTTSYSDGSYKKEMPGDPTFNKPGNISLTVHKDGKAELTCTARRADNLYTPIITHRYENYKDNNTTDLESWTKQGTLISTTINPNCKSYKPYTYYNKKYELAQETKKAQEEAKKSQDKLKKLQEESKRYN